MKKRISIFLVMLLTIMLMSFTSVFAADDFEIGVNNLNNTPENSAKIGNQLLHPEKGWKRFDDTDNNISYIGDWRDIDNINHYNNSCKSCSPNGKLNKIKFNFTGNKIRIISYTDTNKLTDVKIIIDNIENQFSQYKDNVQFQTLCYEENKLKYAEHSVEIYTNEISTTESLTLDAIDIDENGGLKPYNPCINLGLSLNKTSLNLNVGQSESLIATVTPDNATNKKVVWSSSDENIAKVDQNGMVTAVTTGSAIITATIEGTDISASCTVNVNKEVSNGRAILNVTLTNGTIKEYDLSMAEINDFITWYNGRAEGKGNITYCINKNANIKPFNSRKDYLVFDKIYSFEVNEYENK